MGNSAMPGSAMLPPPRRHSVVGPLILIVIGSLILLRNFGVTIRLFHNFVKFWPLILIFVGVVRLAEFFVARKAQRPMPRMGGGTVFLLFIVVVAGMGLSAVYRKLNGLDWGGLQNRHGIIGRDGKDRNGGDVDDGLQRLFGNEYSYNGELSQPIPGGGALRVSCERGNVTVHQWDHPQVKVVYHKRIFAGSQGEADSTNQSTMPKLQLQGATVEVQANTEGAGAKGVASDIEVFLPLKANIEVTAQRGDVAVTERTGDVKVVSQHGDVSVEQVTGNVHVTSSHGSLHASTVTGNLAADGRLDDLALETVSGTVSVTAEILGEVRLSELQGGAAIRTSRTELQFARLDGDLTMDSSGLDGDGVHGPLSLTTKGKDVTLRKLSGDVHISDDNGDIELEPAALGNLELTTHHGNVQLLLPAKANFQYQVVARHGDISSDFKDVRAEGHTGASSASGAVGRGGVKIEITSDSGNVEIGKAEASASPGEHKHPAMPEKPARRGNKVGDVEVM